MGKIFNRSMILFWLAVSPGLSQSGNFNIPDNDFEESAKIKIKALQGTIADLKSERGDFIDRRGNLMLRIIKEMLKEKADEAVTQKDQKTAAYLQQEITDLQSFRDEVWAHSLKVRDLEHQLEQLNVGLLGEEIVRLITYCETNHFSKIAEVLKETQAQLKKPQPLIDRKYELYQKATSVKERDDFQEVSEICEKIRELQKQLDQIVSDTEKKIRQIKSRKDQEMQSI